eukprot:Gregarina_sp_Pseudo_9__3247@NODE_3430_length_650_cov_24_659574_g3129_i0_p1_GENE_NODE_3430_length_650_cov_24_659574_g3129_i0NODE_3430_length_650_cov_24_659574_g3129_i0_p1_ORF_typecomplete_len123_score2_80_NODE_3430_length_650_cov_24_659574_g3129_i0114482
MSERASASSVRPNMEQSTFYKPVSLCRARRKDIVCVCVIYGDGDLFEGRESLLVEGKGNHNYSANRHQSFQSSVSTIFEAYSTSSEEGVGSEISVWGGGGGGGGMGEIAGYGTPSTHGSRNS